MDQRITQAQVEQNYYITAPISGRLASLSAHLGLAVNSQRVIGDVIPENGLLLAKLLVPSRAAGFVEERQTVRLLYDAYPYQKFGFHLGSISSVSRSVIDNAQLPVRVEVREPVFIVDVKLKEQSLSALNSQYDLQSGMAISADIVLENRKIWEWILEPILKGRSG